MAKGGENSAFFFILGLPTNQKKGKKNLAER